MGFSLAPLAFTVIAASHPTYDADACQQIRNVHELAVKHDLRHANLEKLEALYCAPAPRPERPAMQRERCDELQTVEWLAAMTSDDQAARVAPYREATCDGYAPAPRTWDNGRLARTSGGTWYFPNGHLAITSGGTWYWPNGRLARTTGGTWYYPNGRMAVASSGRWYDTTGRLSDEANIVTGVCRKQHHGKHHNHGACRETWRELQLLDGDARTARLLQLAWSGRA